MLSRMANIHTFRILNSKQTSQRFFEYMSNEYKADRTITAVLQEEKQVDNVVRRLIDRGVPQDHISVMGQNFQSQTRIAGFISKKDVILGGLRTGAVFGS